MTVTKGVTPPVTRPVTAPVTDSLPRLSVTPGGTVSLTTVTDTRRPAPDTSRPWRPSGGRPLPGTDAGTPAGHPARRGQPGGAPVTPGCPRQAGTRRRKGPAAPTAAGEASARGVTRPAASPPPRAHEENPVTGAARALVPEAARGRRGGCPGQPYARGHALVRACTPARMRGGRGHR